jgi:DNA-binding transcriptional ArsR family regulator
MADSLSDRYADLLTGSYDCVDRIVLNAYFRMGHDPGGFRLWWRALTGSDETLDNTHLMRLAGRFSRRLRAWAQAKGIPVVDCPIGERKHELAEEYLAKTKITQGLFLILVGRAPAPVWDVSGKHHLERKKPLPYVNHYSFHILDPEWGHITIKISGHPPFPAQVILNGHEYVACQARKAGICFTKEGNCFTHISDAAGLAKIADTLSGQRTIGRLSRVCERWIYTTCLCLALDLEDQKQSGFHYQYSNYQVEYSRNLIFEIGGHMDQVFQALIDRSRVLLDLKTVRTILGYQRRPRYRKKKKKSAEWEVVVEKPVYDLTILKLHCSRLTLKIYTKGERVLRIEVVVHNTQELRCGRSLEKFPEIVVEAKNILERFMDALSCIDQCFIADRILEQLPAPSQVGKTKVGGIDLNKARIRWVIEAVIALSPSPGGFTASELARQVRALSKQSESDYGPRRAAYDLKKLRGKKIVRRIGQTRRYESLPKGLRAMAALVVLRNKAIKPLLAGAQEQRPSRGAQNPSALDKHYDVIRAAMRGVFQELGVAA